MCARGSFHMNIAWAGSRNGFGIFYFTWFQFCSLRPHLHSVLQSNFPQINLVSRKSFRGNLPCCKGAFDGSSLKFRTVIIDNLGLAKLFPKRQLSEALQSSLQLEINKSAKVFSIFYRLHLYYTFIFIFSIFALRFLSSQFYLILCSNSFIMGNANFCLDNNIN